MLIRWRHPDTEAPATELRECLDDQVKPGVVITLDPETYVSFMGSRQWTFAEKRDGTIVYVPLDECIQVEGTDHDVAPTSVQDGEAGMAVARAGQEGAAPDTSSGGAA